MLWWLIETDVFQLPQVHKHFNVVENLFSIVTPKQMSTDYLEKFDSSRLTVEEQNLFSDFLRRRKIFDFYLLSNNIDKVTCPGCGYPTLQEKGAYEICKVCNWEDDGQDDENADEILSGGPNGNISLTQNRTQILKELTDEAQLAGKMLSEDPKHVYRALFENFYPPNLY